MKNQSSKKIRPSKKSKNTKMVKKVVKTIKVKKAKGASVKQIPVVIKPVAAKPAASKLVVIKSAIINITGSKPVSISVEKLKHHFKLNNIRKIAILGFTAVFLFAVVAIAVNYNSSEANNSEFTKPVADTLNVMSENDDAITLLATGDILLARYVELNMRRLKNYTFPFQKTADFLKSADITIGNLETPLCDGSNTPTGSTLFRGDVDGIKGLTFAGFDVVSLANNHTMNFKAPCMLNTLGKLKEASILTTGGGANQDAAHTPALVEVKGKRIAFQSYIDESIPGLLGIAKWNEAGIAAMNIDSMKNDVKNALDHGADIVVVSMHAGREYTRKSTQFQKDFAHAAIDAGASVVIGHHPHWVQPCEEYGNGVICYSLGNFVFDQFFSWDVQTGLIAGFVFEDGEKPQLNLYPVKIDKTQPRILEGKERDDAMKKLGM